MAAPPVTVGPGRPVVLRTLIAISIGIASGIFAFAIAAGFIGSSLPAVLIAISCAGVVACVIRARSPIPLDDSACSRALGLLAAATGVAALVLLARLTVFMVDSTRPDYSFIPASQWEVHHSCVSAYFVAARAADRVPNVYADSLYTSRDDDPTKPRKALRMGRFNIDVYEYPPTFLLMPRALWLAIPDFERYRTMWFGLNGAVIFLALLVLARWLGPIAGTRALLLSPLVWLALPTFSHLQKGNVQALIIAISVLAMVLFHRRRWAAGGLLLAYATVSKLFPGLLVVPSNASGTFAVAGNGATASCLVSPDCYQRRLFKQLV